MVNGHGLMEVSGQAGQVGIQENLQEGQMITILNSGGEKTAGNGTMFQRLMEEEFYVNMTQQLLKQPQHQPQQHLQQQPQPQPLQHFRPQTQHLQCQFFLVGKVYWHIGPMEEEFYVNMTQQNDMHFQLFSLHLKSLN